MAATSLHTPDSDYLPPTSALKLTPVDPPRHSPVKGSKVTPVSIPWGSRLKPRTERGPGEAEPFLGRNPTAGSSHTSHCPYPHPPGSAEGSRPSPPHRRVRGKPHAQPAVGQSEVSGWEDREELHQAGGRSPGGRRTASTVPVLPQSCDF